MKCGEWTQHFVITHTLTLAHVDHFTSIREISIEDKIDKIE